MLPFASDPENISGSYDGKEVIFAVPQATWPD
jgi:hypothetical protein